MIFRINSTNWERRSCVKLTLTTEEGSCNRGDDPEQIPHQAELVGILAVWGEGVEDCGHDHTDLVAPDDDEDHREVLPSHPARDRGWDEVPEEDVEEEDEAEEVGPDVEGLVMPLKSRQETLPPTLVWAVPGENKTFIYNFPVISWNLKKRYGILVLSKLSWKWSIWDFKAKKIAFFIFHFQIPPN